LHQGHDPDTGKEFWRWGTWNPTRIGHWRLVPSATVVRASCGPAGRRMRRFMPEALAAKGISPTRASHGKATCRTTEETNKARESLETREVSKRRADAAVLRRKILRCSWQQEETPVPEPSGKSCGPAIWAKATSSHRRRRRTARLHDELSGRSVRRAGRGSEFKLLHSAAMGDGENTLRASITISHGQLFIRTLKTLYCVGKK